MNAEVTETDFKKKDHGKKIMYVLKVFLVYSHLLVTSTGPNIICQKEPSLQKNIGIISKKEAAGHE